MNSPPPSDARSDCECPVAGWCERYKKRQSPKHHAICSGTSDMPPDRVAIIKENWRRQVAGEKPKRQQQPVDDGIPCDFRGGRLEKINCGCSGEQWTYRCNQGEIAGGVCILRVVPKLPSEYRSMPNCLLCKSRVADGESQPPLS